MTGTETNEELALLWQAKGDDAERALSLLTTRNEPLLLRMLKRWKRRTPTVDWDDLHQEARMAVRVAADGFDPVKGAFTTYLGWWVDARVRRFYKNARAVAIPISKGPRQRGLHLIRDASVDAMAEAGHFLREDAVEGPDVELERRQDAAEAADLVARFSAVLAAEGRHRDCVLLALVLKGFTLEVMGKCLSISRERARQLQERLFDELRDFAGAPRVVQTDAVYRRAVAYRRLHPHTRRRPHASA